MELDDLQKTSSAPLDPVMQFEGFLQLHENPVGTFVYRKRIIEMLARNETWLDIDYNDMMLHDPNLAKVLHENPVEIMKKAGQAITNIAHDITSGTTKLDQVMQPRFYNLGMYHQVTIRGMRAEHVGKLVSMAGTIIRATQPLPEVTIARFECTACGVSHDVQQLSDDLVYPAICNAGGCQNKARKNFKFIDRGSRLANWQQVRVQEHVEESRGSGMPRWVDCILMDDLVDKHLPGEHVIITGYLNALLQKIKGATGTSKVLRYMLHVNHVMAEATDPDQLEITEEDEKKIKELAATPGIHDMIWRSIAPEIHGMDMVKEACALQLFSGSGGATKSGHKLRGDIHVLVMGDPSTGKSVLARAVIKLLLGSRGVVGQGVTGAGLAASIVRDEYTGNVSIEAGALVLADCKICVIDEFDKLKAADRVMVNEVMEQQTASIDKAGLHMQLNARVSILACANPKLGRWNDKLTIGENINMDAPLLSRFDILLVVLDEPDEAVDKGIAHHVTALHMAPAGLEAGEARAIVAPIDTPLLVKYIQYARNECKPRITATSQAMIEEFYTNSRKLHASKDDPIPIVVRSLEGIIRMCEARAKMALRETVLDEDVDAVTALYKKATGQITVDKETGKFDVDVVQLGSTQSKRQAATRLRDLIRKIREENGGEPVSRDALISRLQYGNENVAWRVGNRVDEARLDEALERLKKETMIIEKKNGMYVDVK